MGSGFRVLGTGKVGKSESQKKTETVLSEREERCSSILMTNLIKNHGSWLMHDINNLILRSMILMIGVPYKKQGQIVASDDVQDS